MYDREIKGVVVDAGHGGSDPGAVNGNIYEKDFNLQVARYIYNRLRELGIPAAMTRAEDTNLPKDERIKKVESLFGLDPNVILLSNHMNSGGGEGAEIVYALRNDATLANMILDNIGAAGQIKRKAYQRRLPENPNKDYYYIIRETSPIQALLIEYGFIDNPNDLKKLQNDLDSYAEGVVKAVADYIGVQYNPPGISEEGYYTVMKGDTLYSIARRFNVTVDELMLWNNLSNNTLSIGQRLRISPNIGNENIYIVQKGDSLWSIARRFNITVDDLLKANGLTNLTIYIGQKLKIPNNEDINNMIIYTVVPGDTLWNISKRYGVTVDDIINANRLTSTLLSLGQQLIIPQ